VGYTSVLLALGIGPACGETGESPEETGETGEASATTSGSATSVTSQGDSAESESPSTTSGDDDTTESGGSQVPPESQVPEPSAALSPYLLVDQFGYLPRSEKIGVLRDPRTGYDADESYAPPANIQLVDAQSGEVVLERAPAPWNEGAEHAQSGDAAWWFDFSEIETPGVYYLLDPEQNVRSGLFRIAPDVYEAVLRHALRTFFYQRAGFAKEAVFATDAWADAASHVAPGQDTEARLYSATDDPSTARDVSGGWYDAGDFNKYTAWTADYVTSLLRAHETRPQAFDDDLGIPESGNGIPDILDEVRFCLEHLLRLQEDDGSVLSIVDLDHASPPSAATGPSRYGPPSTNASVRAAMAYSAGARAFSAIDAEFGDALREAAILAWDWTEANPEVVFRNNEGDNDLGAGQQEVDAETLALYRVAAAVELFRSTGDTRFLDYFEAGWEDPNFGPINWYVAGWQQNLHDAYLDYASLPEADPAIAEAFLERYETGLASDDNFGMLEGSPDPFLGHVVDYTWGSNAHKARTGLVFYSVIEFGLDAYTPQDAERAASRYVHYLHGVNPLAIVYLSNMSAEGAERSVTEFYHTWFGDGTPWDSNPAPGFLTGGPNPSYDWEQSCCVEGSCSASDQALCEGGLPSPPSGQPPQKSYLDFNANWPLNSWSVTENSNGYQVAYIRLLSKFVE